jgi:hypothetical protein
VLDSKGIKWREDLSVDAAWLFELLLVGEGDLDFLQQYAEVQERNLELAIAELEGHELLRMREVEWIELPFHIMPAKEKEGNMG